MACDVSEKWTAIGKKRWEQAGVSNKIDLQIRPALETQNILLSNGHRKSFDFAFIDADKSNYFAYYEKCLELVRKGGLIAIDNVLWGGSVIDSEKQDSDTKAIRELNDFVSKDRRVSISMIPVGDGLTLAVVL